MKLAPLLLFLCIGCAGALRSEPQTAEAIVRSQTKPRSIVDARTGKTIELEEFLAELRTRRVVYVGERHDQALDHAAQYAILRMLHRNEASLAVGMEMFQTPFQAGLDLWSAGRIDETVLRRETEYDQRWGYDFSLYRPILEYARHQGLEVVALNAPKELAYAVAKGGVDSLTPEQASEVPELDLDDAEHRALFDQAFDVGEHDVGDGIDRYYQAQVLWDETMGARVAETLAREDGPAKMLVLAGRVHVSRGLGIPSRAARRGAAPFAVVIPLTSEGLRDELDEAPEDRAADFFWVVEQ